MPARGASDPGEEGRVAFALVEPTLSRTECLQEGQTSVAAEEAETWRDRRVCRHGACSGLLSSHASEKVMLELRPEGTSHGKGGHRAPQA